MITSEEKMRNNQWQQAGWIADWILRHNLTAAIANSATAFVELQDHLAALQESEAGQSILYTNMRADIVANAPAIERRVSSPSTERSE